MLRRLKGNAAPDLEGLGRFALKRDRGKPLLFAGRGDEIRRIEALAGFARAGGVEVAALERREHKGRERFCATVEMPSVPLEDALPQMVEGALQGVSVPRLMRWDGSKRRFVRPVRGIVMMHGPRMIAGEVMGVPGGNSTRGHRLLAPHEIGIASADAYEQTLREQGHVVAGAQGAHHFAGAVRPLGHAALRNRLPAPLDQAVDDRIVGLTVDGDRRNPGLLRRARGDLPVADVAGKEDASVGGALGFLQMVAPDELDPPVGSLDREAMNVRVLRGDAAEMAPHAVQAAPDLGGRKLRHSPGEVVEAPPVHREQRADQAAESGAESRGPSHRQCAQHGKEGIGRGSLADVPCRARQAGPSHDGSAR